MKSLHVEVATLADVDAILELIIELSRWLKTKGIAQWGEDYPREKIESDVQANFVYLIRERGRISATVTLTDLKDAYWNDFSGDAIYLHRLAVCRSRAGKNLGTRLIGWCESEVQRRCVKRLRLDCDSQNLRLRSLYESLGYLFRGTRRIDEYNMDFALFEKSFSNCLEDNGPRRNSQP